jgi:hypothetical protein
MLLQIWRVAGAVADGGSQTKYTRGSIFHASSPTPAGCGSTDSGTPLGAGSGLRVWVRVWVSGLGFGVSGSSMGTGPTGELGPATGRGVVVGC